MASVKWKFNEEEQAVTVNSLSGRPRSKCEVTISLSDDMMRDVCDAERPLFHRNLRALQIVLNTDDLVSSLF